MTATAEPAAVPEMGLFARAIGVITAPTATFQSIVAKPRPVGILFLIALVVAVAAAAPMFTTAGQQSILEAQAAAREGMGRPMTPEEYAGMERFAPYFAYFTIAQVFIGLPIFSLIITALLWVVFNTLLGGAASFKQVLAIVTHSQVIGAIGAVLGAPIQIIQQKVTTGGPFNLGALVPMLEETSTLYRFLSATSVFTLWGFVVTGIGIAVLYRRKSTGVVIGLLVAYVVIAYSLTSMFSSWAGGGSAGR